MLWADLLFCLQLFSNSNKKMFGFCVRILFFWSNCLYCLPLLFLIFSLTHFVLFILGASAPTVWPSSQLKQKYANAARKSTMVGRLWSMANKRNALHFLQLLRYLPFASLGSCCIKDWDKIWEVLQSNIYPRIKNRSRVSSTLCKQAGF